jgi:hypothetical protein
VALAAFAALALAAVSGVGTAHAATQTFSSIGAEQMLTVPAGVSSVHILAIGGGGGSSGLVPGGAAAQVSADLPVIPGQLLFVEVAGNGQSAENGGANGFNGGGTGGLGGAGGGGASDVRTAPGSTGLSPDSRLIVAAGGGGAAGGAGGVAGGDGSTGAAPNEQGSAGTSSAGGAGGLGSVPSGNGASGELGRGGNGGNGLTPQGGGGGGGGGYYGGGGGGGGGMSVGGGGGGGSSLVPSGGSQNVVATGTAPQVQITYTPFSLGKVKRHKRKGTATLSVDVPGPGTLVLTGKGLVKQRPGGASRAVRIAAKTVSAAGKVTLRVKSKGKKRRKLNRAGKVRVKAKVMFTNTGGVPLTKAKRVKLVKRKR